MQVYKTKWFARFARQEGIADANLTEAIKRAEQGLIHADLGGGLIKQRVARQGKGRSGGYRTIIAYRAKGRAVFLFGFAKSDQENVDAKQLTTARKIAEKLLSADAVRIAHAIAEDELQEVEVSKQKNRLTEALLETAEGMHRIGILDDNEYRQITVRHLRKQPLPIATPINGNEIRSLREQANMSQAAFARSLNLSVGYISQLERGTKQPKGPALALLNVIKRKGFEVIL
jgi:putative transcriptional regulator